MTPEGEGRWTTYSIFDGEEKWKSEGIQLGGIRSARGVVGNWFDKCVGPNDIHRDRKAWLTGFDQRLRPPWPMRTNGVLEGIRPEPGRRRIRRRGGRFPAHK